MWPSARAARERSPAAISTTLTGGKRRRAAAQTDPFGFGAQAGYYTDVETGLVLCTHRYYDPATGRWLTRDPIGYRGGVNLYGYVENNPENDTDASGYWGDSDTFRALTCAAAAVTLEEELKKGVRGNPKKIALCSAVLAACANYYCSLIPKPKYPIYTAPFPVPFPEGPPIGNIPPT